VVAAAPSPLYRNASGDELLYVQDGAGVVETVYGALDVAAGDYVVLPTSMTYRVVPGGVVAGRGDRRRRAGAPHHHANVDSDELMFYVGGSYQARRGSGIGLGSLSLHPSGCTHGPQPGAVEASLGAERFEETAVMVDTFRPLELGTGAQECEDPAYAWSWAGRGPGS